MGIASRFVTRAAVPKFMAFENAGLFEQADGAVDRRNRDAGINRRRAGMKRLDIGMIFRLRKYARDHAPLLGDAEPFFGA